jgi:transcription initiation factor TFIIF subunit beta
MQDELKNLVFHHFEEREYWPLKELNYHCRQPEVRPTLSCSLRSWFLVSDSGTLMNVFLVRWLVLQSFLKEVLKEICEYNRKGPNKSCYELKPQYKDGVSSHT